MPTGNGPIPGTDSAVEQYNRQFEAHERASERAFGTTERSVNPHVTGPAMPPEGPPGRAAPPPGMGGPGRSEQD